MPGDLHRADGTIAVTSHGTNPFGGALARNTRLFLNCLEGLTDVEAAARPNERTNSLAFVALHLVDVRFYLAGFLGVEAPNPYREMLEDVTRIEEIEAFPPLTELCRVWLEASLKVQRKMDALTDTELSAKSAESFPLTGDTVSDGLGFLLHHESYHIGQLALLRKYVGHEAVSWS